MPLYEYECTACHKRTEKIQKFSDPEITLCPKCGGPLDRVISAPAISFKGGGWFSDGYGNAKPAANATGSSEGGNPEGGGKDSGGKDGESKAGGSESRPSTDGTAAAATAPAAPPATSSPAPAAASSSDKG